MIISQCSPTINSVTNPPCLIRLYCPLVSSLVKGSSCSNHYSPIPSPLLTCPRRSGLMPQENNDARFNKVSGIRPSWLNLRINCRGMGCLLRRLIWLGCVRCRLWRCRSVNRIFISVVRQ